MRDFVCDALSHPRSFGEDVLELLATICFTASAPPDYFNPVRLVSCLGVSKASSLMATMSAGYPICQRIGSSVKLDVGQWARAGERAGGGAGGHGSHCMCTGM